MRRREDLSTPRQGRRLDFGVHYDPDAFGEFSEGIARFFGTARFLVIQSIVVVFWIALNAVSWGLRWDPYPFILLNLMFSTQAAYAAPLILLAQNRQEERDRAETERDRERAERVQSDTEYLAREIASIRLALSDMVTSVDLDESVDRIAKLVESVLDPSAATARATAPPSDG
jgi:uncharacterized membrane protein